MANLLGFGGRGSGAAAAVMVVVLVVDCGGGRIPYGWCLGYRVFARFGSWLLFCSSDAGISFLFTISNAFCLFAAVFRLVVVRPSLVSPFPRCRRPEPSAGRYYLESPAWLNGEVWLRCLIRRRRVLEILGLGFG
ncbi:hypothetical protein RHMOL_Rhmol13G0175200 [Rhododendron molle]|uniref:Uncharacterized protein n=1 Tax=Rhododendron molle TaxID=49168 RepID=A0ACC0L7U5_RHOML|nr:hypothetical protein RHMOL_Rhmol13G0175200 [Rhododendron molle]